MIPRTDITPAKAGVPANNVLDAGLRRHDDQHLLKGKNIAVFGVANKWSIAWAITQALSHAGAQLVLTYIDERTEEKVRSLAASLPLHPLILPCDVMQDDQVDTVFAKIKHEFGK